MRSNLKYIFNKELTKALLLLLSLFFLANILPTDRAKAYEEPAELLPVFATSFYALPETNAVPKGYMNSLSTGFRVYAAPAQGLVFNKIAIFIDDSSDPIDQRFYDNSVHDYYLSSNTSSNGELANILSEGLHNIHFKYQSAEGSEFINYKTFPVWCDYSGPSGQLTYNTKDGKKRLKIGDWVNFTFSPDDGVEDVSRVEFSLGSNNYEGVLSPNGSYEFSLKVGQGDLYGGGGELSALVVDLAGNQSRYSLVVDFEIDGVPPTIEILSPTINGRYAVRTISVSYKIFGDYLPDSIVFRLNGEVISGNTLFNLLDGFHIFSVQVEDAFGNITIEEVLFEIDTSYPQYTLIGEAGGPFTHGDEFEVSGSTEPGARVVLEIYSDVLKMETYADSTGKFSFKIKTSLLAVGFHNLYLSFFDELGNNIRFKLSGFEVVAPLAVKQEPVKLAVADHRTITDGVNGTLVAGIKSDLADQKPELAKSGGSTSSSAVSRDGFNLTIYLLVFGAILVVALLMIVGYRSFEALFAGAENNSVRIKQVEKYSKEESTIQETVAGGDGGGSNEDEKKDREVRW